MSAPGFSATITTRQGVAYGAISSTAPYMEQANVLALLSCSLNLVRT